MMTRVAGALTMYLHGRQGMPGAPQRSECLVFVRDSGLGDGCSVVLGEGVRLLTICTRPARCRSFVSPMSDTAQTEARGHPHDVS